MNAAPAVILFGAYFPDWLILAIVAISSAVIARIVFAICGRAEAVPYPLFTFLAAGILVAGSIDLLWLGQ